MAAPTATHFCPDCGTPVDGATFCPNCGRSLAAPPPEPVEDALPTSDVPTEPSRLDRWRERRRQNRTVALWQARGVKHARAKFTALVICLTAPLVLLAVIGAVGAGGSTPPATGPVTASALIPLEGTYTGQQLVAVVGSGGCNVSALWPQIAADPAAFRGHCATFAGTAQQDQNVPTIFYLRVVLAQTLAGGAYGPLVAVQWANGPITPSTSSLDMVIGTIQGGMTIHVGQTVETVPLVTAVDVDNSRLHG